MASLIAYFFAPEEVSSFNTILYKYINDVKSLQRGSRDEEFEEFKLWFDALDVSDLENSPSVNFIPQCEGRDNINSPAQKSVDGFITSISEDGGLIEGHIYFKPSDVCAFNDDDIVKIGDRVQADAVKGITGNCGWTATRVVKISALESEKNCVWEESVELGRGSMVVPIADIENNQCTVQQGIKFTLEIVQEGYVPIIGDWIKLKADADGKIMKVEPLRIKEVTGRVTQQPRVDKDGNEAYRGTINNDIEFSFNVCEKGYKPWRDDEVQAIAIESKQIWCSWRATSVRLIAKAKKNNKISERFKASDWTLRGGYPFAVGKRNTLPSFLPKYPIPVNVKERVENGRDVLCLLPSLKTNLCLDNYAARFGALIYLEEIYADIEIRQHGLRGSCLERRGEYLCLHVPGITDGKPSLSIGDIVVLHELAASEASGLEYHGFIHHIVIEKEEILLKFHPTFLENFQVSDRYDVEFKYSRAPFRRCHFAVRLAQRRNSVHLLFPDKIHKLLKQCTATLNIEKSDRLQKVYFNSALNMRQTQAVQRILHGECRKHPYVLFGPPGTGKTVTLVEVVLQLYHSLKWCRILVCAPSNSAVDVICERLALTGLVDNGDMVRFNAFRRLEPSIPETISKFCHKDEDVERISRYRIILTTCVNSGIFYDLQLSKDHITHICIDEAGQATEPEVLIPIGLQTNGQIIMAGDPEQLGPVIMSPLANMYGLNLSLLERLMKLPAYTRDDALHKDGYNPLLVTKLTDNYRSHSHLLELPSKMFYMGELQPCAQNIKYEALLQWDKLPKKGFPIIFHGIVGQQLRESDCPSLMNPTEIVQAIRYIKMLHRDENMDLVDIGVISPYRKQVEKLRIMLRAVGINGVKVGSVEEFQGQEKSVVVISTVRSNPGSKITESDISVRGALGFLSNCKRFNVATTRAKILMIVLGNPHVLSLDPHWRDLLKYCILNGGYKGCDVTSLKL